MIKRIVLSLVLATLSACFQRPPTRGTADFNLLLEGKIPQESRLVFSDCLFDNWDGWHH